MYTQSLLTDLYQFTISKAQWDHGRADDYAVFDLFYRTNPFDGTFAIFGGLSEVIEFLKNFKFTEEELSFIKESIPNCEDVFIDYLRRLDTRSLTISAPKEGSILFLVSLY
jgi:nicotinate phosphoribosyltransferase